MTTQVNSISAAKRKGLPEGKFALPALRKYPIDTAARVRNAAARLEQNKSTLTAAQYATAKKAIGAAAKRFGIESKASKKADDGLDGVHQPGAGKFSRPRRGLHLHIGAGGDIEIRHARDVRMFDALPFADAARLTRLDEIDAALKAADETAAVTLRAEAESLARHVWIQIAKVGEFRGHPAGPFALNPAVFDQLVQNFTAVDKARVPIDFEHASEADAADGSIPQEGAPAQGWVRALENRGAAGLWGLVEWLEPARTYIREGKYQAVSPAIRFGAKHPETGAAIGARLTSVALTNRPFLRGMQTVVARDGKDTTMLDTPLTSHGEFMPRLRAALRLGELASYAECKDQLDRLREMCMSAASQGQSPMGIHEGVALGEYISPMRALMNMPANATLEEMFDAVEEMVEAAMERHEALYHGGNETDAAAMTDATTEGDTAMADKTLKDIEAERDGALAKLRDTESQTASLGLRLKDAEAKAAEKDAEVAKLAAEVAKMRDDQAKRDEADATARVDEAFAAYKDAKKLSDADKTAMSIVLKADPATFDKLYPRIAPNQQHLLRNLSGQQLQTGNAQPRPATTMSQGRRPDVPDHAALAAQGAPVVSTEAAMRGRAAKALASGAPLETAILMTSRAS